MKQSRATIRYAKALLQLSIEQNTLEESYYDMALLDGICSQSKELSLLLKSPIVKTDHKLKIFDLIFKNKISKVSMSFVNIIIVKKRESLLQGIAKSFVNLYKTYNNIETATITTAIKISEELKNKVILYIKTQTNNKVELKEVIDENIIGGAIIRMGDKQLDASISTEISELRQTFNKNLYLQDF
jgi:F-type H+-transporting ATPase subunit delta